MQVLGVSTLGRIYLEKLCPRNLGKCIQVAGFCQYL